MLFDIALWLRASSSDPEIVTLYEVDPSFTIQDVVLSLMRELRETYVFKASVHTPYGFERLFRLSLPREVPDCQVSTLDIVAFLWPILEADSLDPVEVCAADALGLARALASDDPGSPLALWCQSALAVDERLFSDFWNHRRSAIARSRLYLELESEVSDGHPI